MSYTMEDFQRWYAKEHFPQLTPQEQREALELLSPEQRQALVQSLPASDMQALVQSRPLEERLAGLSKEAIRQYLEQQTSEQAPRPRKPRGNK